MGTATAPYRSATIGVLALGAMLLGLATSVSYWSGAEGAFDLRDLIIAARASLLALAFPLGWLGVWAASVHAPDSVIIGAAPGRSRRTIVLRQAAVLAGAISVGWLAGWAVPVGMAIATQYWTRVDLLAMLTLAVAVGSLTSIGLAVAMLVGIRVGAFLAPAALLCVMALPAFWINDVVLSGLPVSTQALSYVWSITAPVRGDQLVWGTEVVRLGFYLLVFVTAAQAAAGLAEFRATRNHRATASITWLAFPLAVSVAVSVVMPLLYVEDPNDQVRCRSDAGFTLCLYQIDEPQRGEFEAFLAPLVQLLPAEQVSATTFTQASDGTGDVSFSRLGSGRDTWIRNQLSSVASNLFLPALAPEYRCEGKPEETITTTDRLEASVKRQVGTRAAAATADDPRLNAEFTTIADPGDAGSFEPADRWLDELTDGQFRDWYHQHRPQLDACTLTEQDFR
ncbi:MAG: hypothetical protein VB093_09235 [Propionicimonas sp.]|nr:hypothetical protein [Propionicimonas sp.]